MYQQDATSPRLKCGRHSWLGLGVNKQGTDLIDLRRILEGLIFGLNPFGGLGGRYSLQTASEVRYAHRFEISDFEYLHIHVHIAYMEWTLLADPRSLQPPNSLGGHH